MDQAYGVASSQEKNPVAEQCLANADVVLEDAVVRGAVHIVGDSIAGITEGGLVPVGAEDMAGDILIPGLVEVHTDNLERHLEPRPAVQMPRKPAILAHDGELASAGITTVFDALRVGSNMKEDKSFNAYAREVSRDILALREDGALRVRHMLHLRAEVCSETLLEEFAQFGPDDRVRLVSLMDHTPGQRQFRDLSKLATYYKGKFGYTDEAFDRVVRKRTELSKRVREPHEAATLQEAARLGATLASHDDTTIEHVEKSAQMGITLAEFPTTLEAAEACRAHGIDIIMGAPNLIRGGSHSGNVSAIDLAERGLLDIVSSDYVPSLLLGSAFRLAEIWGDLARAVRTVTMSPANATGLSDRGRIQEGCVADLVRISMVTGLPVIRSVWRGAARVG